MAQDKGLHRNVNGQGILTKTSYNGLPVCNTWHRDGEVIKFLSVLIGCQVLIMSRALVDRGVLFKQQVSKSHTTNHKNCQLTSASFITHFRLSKLRELLRIVSLFFFLQLIAIMITIMNFIYNITIINTTMSTTLTTNVNHEKHYKHHHDHQHGHHH